MREAIAAGIMTFRYVPGSDNPADILTKHWGYQQIWGLQQPLLFWQGDTMDLVGKDRKNKTVAELDPGAEQPTIVIKDD